MNDTVLKMHMAERLEYRIEIEQKLKAEYQTKMDELTEEIAFLKNQLADQKDATPGKDNIALQESGKVIQKLKTDKLSLQSQNEKLTGELQSLRHQHKKLRENHEKIKPEWNEFKKMDPRSLKKKLEAKRKEVKEKAEGMQSMQKLIATKDEKLKKQNELVFGLKRELQLIHKRPEVAEDSYIFKSECGQYGVFPTDFQSDSRPYLADDFNYRVLNLEDGTSLVAAQEDGEITFSHEIPEDVAEFIKTTLSSDTDEETSETSESE